MRDFMQVTIIGGGYVGLVTGACLASAGHHVEIIDVDEQKVRAIKQAEPLIYEEGLEKILKESAGTGLTATTDYARAGNSDLILICVGTPQREDGSADLHYIRDAAEEIGRSIRDSSRYVVIAVKSTVPPGTCENIVKPAVTKISGRNPDTIGFAMNPEFLREGRAVSDFLNPDRIVIGADSERAYELLEQVYRDFSAPKIRTSLTAAEMIKYTSNAFLATKISFSNEIGNLCKKLNLDVYEVMKAVGLDSRIGPQFLNAGAGFGGSCFPKDVQALVHLATDSEVDPVLLKSVLAVNEAQPAKMIDLLIRRSGSLNGKKIAVLGLAFKDNTDDIRESRSIPVIRMLLDAGASITAYDPMANGHMAKIFPDITYCSSSAAALTDADGALIMTEWPEFRNISEELSKMKQQIVIDGRHLVSGPGVEGICW
jgi:UDPglucose 6-dehydrogenase